MLTKFEKEEIFNYPQVWFVGPTAQKIQADPNAKANNYGYDNEKGRYKAVKHDHINYRFEVLQNLGRGSFGDVVKVYDHKKHCNVALKIIRNEKRFHDQAAEEIKILEALTKKDRSDKHNVIHMHESFLFRNHLCITFEMLAGDLYGELKRGGFKGFPLERVRKSAVDLVQCLRNLRRNRIIHCDLKPENILQRATGSSNVKVIDFGSSCYLTERVHTYIQSRFYRSPEIVLGVSYGMPIDMWSLGCILCELYTGRPLFPALSETELLLMHVEYLGLPPSDVLRRGSRAGKYFDSSYKFKKIIDQKGQVRHVRPKSLSKLLGGEKNKTLIDFVSKCLEWDPEKRMTPRDASRHPFLAGIVDTTTPSGRTGVTTTANVKPSVPVSASAPLKVTTSHASPLSQAKSSVNEGLNTSATTQPTASHLLANVSLNDTKPKTGHAIDSWMSTKVSSGNKAYAYLQQPSGATSQASTAQMPPLHSQAAFGAAGTATSTHARVALQMPVPRRTSDTVSSSVRGNAGAVTRGYRTTKQDRSPPFFTPASHLKARTMSDSMVGAGVEVDRSTQQQSRIFTNVRSVDMLAGADPWQRPQGVASKPATMDASKAPRGGLGARSSLAAETSTGDSLSAAGIPSMPVRVVFNNA